MKQLAELKVQFQKQWTNFTTKYCYDSELGYLISNDHQIKCFDFEPIKHVLNSLPELNETGQIIQVTESFKHIKLIEPFTFKDMIILHDATAMIAQSYVLQKLKTIKQEEIKLPASIAEPLYISSQYLKCSPGNITVYQYNWQINHDRYKDDIFDLTFQDVNLKWFFTIEKREEANFFVLNFIGSFYMWKIFKQIFFANYLAKKAPWLEGQVVNRLNKAAAIWEKVTQENTKMISMMNDYFYKKLRPYISGFNNVYFEKVDKRLTASRGNTGFDPSYQLYQELMGLSYKVYNPGFQIMRVQMRTVMANIHCQSIQQMEKIADLRGYCKLSSSLTEAYNKVLMNQVKFTRLHNEFVRKYIKTFSPMIESTPPFCYLLKKADALQQNILQVSQNKQKQ